MHAIHFINNYIKREGRESNIHNMSNRYEYTIDSYDPVISHEANSTPVPEKIQNKPEVHPSKDSTHVKIHPNNLDNQHSHVVITYTKYEDPKKHDFGKSKPSELPSNLNKNESILSNGIDIPLAPIEEQLARNEDSKESLPNISNELLERAILEKSNGEPIEIKVSEKARKVIKSASQQKGIRKKSIQSKTSNTGRNYQASTISWNNSRPSSTKNASRNNDSSVRKSIKDKYIVNKDWVQKIENRRRNQFNHYNIPKKLQTTKSKYSEKKAEEDKFR